MLTMRCKSTPHGGTTNESDDPTFIPFLIQIAPLTNAEGPDGARTKDIVRPDGKPLVYKLTKEVRRTKKIPRLWLYTYLLGIPKAHDTVTRGIALTSVCLKVLSAIIRRRSTDNGLLSSQFGFRSHRGTAQATLLLREILHRRARSGKGTTVIFVDLKKAFDSVRRDVLEKIMTEDGFSVTAGELVKQMYDGDGLKLFLNNENKSEAIKQAQC